MDRGDQPDQTTPRAYPTPQAQAHGDVPALPPPQPRTETEYTARPTTSSTEKFDDGMTSGGESSPPREKAADLYNNNNNNRGGGGGGITIAPPPRARSVRDGGGGNYRSLEPGMIPRRINSGADWLAPNVPRLASVKDRLDPTLMHARREREKYEKMAKWNGLVLNIAIGLQVILGALVTGLSSAISPSKVGVTTSTLGGLSTLCASYLARMRGSKEPQLSITRAKDLEQFERECEAFIMDHGHVTSGSEDAKINDLRRRFEELLGNASGERKLSPA